MADERRDYTILISLLTREEAEVMASALRADGVDAFVGDRHHANVDWGWIPALGGLQIFVPADRIDQAKALVRERLREAAEAPDEDATPVKRRDRWKVWVVMLVTFLLPVGGITAHTVDDYMNRAFFDARMREWAERFAWSPVTVGTAQVGCDPGSTPHIQADGKIVCAETWRYLPEDRLKALRDCELATAPPAAGSARAVPCPT